VGALMKFSKAQLKKIHPGSAKWVVRDLTRAEPSVSCDTKEQAEAWVRHLWEWRPNARPVIEREISPNESSSAAELGRKGQP